VNARLSLLSRLLRAATTNGQIADLLKSRGALHSAPNWDALFEERVVPALKAGVLSEGDLLGILADAEETGRQHIFLFQRSQKTLPSPKSLRAWAADNGAQDVLEHPRLVDFPSSRTISEIRSEPMEAPPQLFIKFVESRATETKVSDRTEGNRRIVEYERERERAVHVVVTHGDGLLELRLARHQRSSADYSRTIEQIMSMLAPLLGTVTAIPLVDAKMRMWRERSRLGAKIRFSGQRLRDDSGNVLTGSTGTAQDDLFEEERMEESLVKFIGDNQAIVDTWNVWFKPQKNGTPPKEVHVLLSGAINEYIITQQCSRSSHEYILSSTAFPPS
jgi:hypothetical protein